jgi:drug/metabolite transporter (DMT)-like permease
MTAPHPHDHPHTLRGIMLVVTAVFLFSSMDAVAKHVLKSYPLPPLIWARYAVHLVFMLALVWPRMGLALMRTARPGLQLLRGLLLVASTSFFYLSLTHLPLAEAAAISFVGPVLTTALSGPLLRERVTRRQWAAVSLGFLGVLVIVRPGGGLLTPSAVFPLLTALAFSLYQIITRKIAGREHPLTTLFYTALVGALVTSCALPFSWQTPTLTQVPLIVMIGLLGGLGHFLLIRAVEHASPTTLAPFIYVQLIFSTALAFLAFGDFPNAGSLAGMLVIASAGLLAVDWRHMRRTRDAGDPARVERSQQENRQ